MIKLKCLSCGYQYEITEEELRENGEFHKYCLMCAGKLEVINLEELVNLDIKQEVKENIDKWLRELGGDETLSIIERTRNEAIYELYKKEMIRRGFIIKDKR